MDARTSELVFAGRESMSAWSLAAI